MVISGSLCNSSTSNWDFCTVKLHQEERSWIVIFQCLTRANLRMEEVLSSSTLYSDALMKSSLKQLCNPELCPTVCLGFMVPMEMYLSWSQCSKLFAILSFILHQSALQLWFASAFSAMALVCWSDNFGISMVLCVIVFSDEKNAQIPTGLCIYLQDFH